MAIELVPVFAHIKILPGNSLRVPTGASDGQLERYRHRQRVLLSTWLAAATLLKTFPTEGSMPLQFEAPQSTALYDRLR